MFLVKNIPIELSKTDILGYLGYKPLKSTSNPKVDALLEQVIGNAMLVLEPAAVYSTFNIEDVSSERISLAGTSLKLEGRGISGFMSSCSKVSFVVATIGDKIDAEIARLFSVDDSSSAVVLDAVGSDAVEQVVSWVDNLIQREATKQGFTTLNRVSPGYSLWSIEANSGLAKVLNAEKIGIEVLPSFEILPRKSVMAAIGWVPKEADTRRQYT